MEGGREDESTNIATVSTIELFRRGYSKGTNANEENNIRKLCVAEALREVAEHLRTEDVGVGDKLQE